MMQQVATAKSEIAAFATSAESNSLADSGSNAQFGQLLQDQKANNPVVVKSKTSSAQTTSKNTPKQSNDEVKNNSALNENNTTQKSNAASDSEKANSIPTSISRKDKTTDDIATEIQSAKSNLGDEAKDVNIKATSESTSKQNDKKSTDETTEIIADEWVLLIDNLKRLTSNSESPISSLEELDESAVDLELSNKVEKELLEQITETTFADNSRISLDGFVQSPVEDIKDPSGPVVITKKPVEQTMSMTVDPDGGDPGQRVQAEQDIAKLVDKALADVIANAELEGLSKVAVTNKMAELLLEQPQTLQELQSLIGQIQASSQDSGTTEKNTLGTTTDSAIRKDQLLFNKQLENAVQADLTLAENKDLLTTLVVETEADLNNTEVPSKLLKTGISETAENLAQTQQAEVGLTKLDSNVDSSELIEQDIQITQAAANIQVNVNKADKVLVNYDIKSLLNLSEGKLDKVLENIAQRVFESKNAGESLSPELLAQQVITPKTTEILNSIESSSKEFISALKSGIDEFKNQLSQGREPGIDLKALVGEALAKTSDTANVVKVPVNLEQIVSSVSQVLDLAQSMSRTIDERHDQVYSATLRDVAQIQGEQSKQIQLNQVESKFEKTVNIAKPEGHQQLAEKVRWMINTKNLVAEIRLDPAELGSMHVKVTMSGESATVNFVVQSQQARDAVDTATPRLREMLAEKGIELGQSSVRQESDGQQGQGDGEFAKQGGRGNDESENIELPEQVLAQQNIVNGALGGIDYFV
jgi:flagellar hook-length control protein FliK